MPPGKRKRARQRARRHGNNEVDSSITSTPRRREMVVLPAAAAPQPVYAVEPLPMPPPMAGTSTMPLTMVPPMTQHEIPHQHMPAPLPREAMPSGGGGGGMRRGMRASPRRHGHGDGHRRGGGGASSAPAPVMFGSPPPHVAARLAAMQAGQSAAERERIRQSLAAQRAALDSSSSSSSSAASSDSDSGGGGPRSSTEQCSICLDRFKRSKQGMQHVLWLPCAHRFHTPCIMNWGKESDQCPICKNPIEANNWEIPADAEGARVVRKLMKAQDRLFRRREREERRAERYAQYERAYDAMDEETEFDRARLVLPAGVCWAAALLLYIVSLGSTVWRFPVIAVHVVVLFIVLIGFISSLIYPFIERIHANAAVSAAVGMLVFVFVAMCLQGLAANEVGSAGWSYDAYAEYELFAVFFVIAHVCTCGGCLCFILLRKSDELADQYHDCLTGANVCCLYPAYENGVDAPYEDYYEDESEDGPSSGGGGGGGPGGSRHMRRGPHAV